MSDWRRATYGSVMSNTRIRARRGSDKAELLSVTATDGVIRQSQSGRRDISASDKSNYLVVQPGDVVYNTMRMWQGVSGFSEIHGIVSPAYTVVRPSIAVLDGRFLSHLMKLPSNIALYRAYSQGLVSDTWNLKFGSLADLELDLPPLEEQQRIAEILDTIDETIQATEQVIAKLTTVQIGVLRAALEAAAPTSYHSTVEREFEIVTGITLNAGRVPRSNPVGYLRVANVHRGEIDISDLAMLEATEDEVVRKGLTAGDLLVVEGHANPAEIGRCALVPRAADGLLFQNHLFRLRSRSIIPDVAELILNSQEARSYWRRMCATSSGLHTINSSMLRAMPISVPDRDHQLVLSELHSATDTSVSTELRQLEKLRKVRSGLAADLLSGRVRTVAA